MFDQGDCKYDGGQDNQEWEINQEGAPPSHIFALCQTHPPDGYLSPIRSPPVGHQVEHIGNMVMAVVAAKVMLC